MMLELKANSTAVALKIFHALRHDETNVATDIFFCFVNGRYIISSERNIFLGKKQNYTAGTWF